MVTEPYRETKFETIGIIIGSVVAFLIVAFCVVDVMCCKMNNTGNPFPDLTSHR
jgi:large-conductance mechanosensitive channel